MPANLPPEYKKGKVQYEMATSPEEKVAILERMLSIIPKHKGTDKRRADLRTRISRHKQEKEAARKKGKRGFSYHVRKQGAGQIVLVGMPNVGKSQLLTSLTRAAPEVAPYPFTTQETVVGMMDYENISFQVVDTPAITAEYVKTWQPDIIKQADLIWLVSDLSSDELLDQIEIPLTKLRDYHMELVAEIPEEDEEVEEEEGDELSSLLWFKKTVIVANKNDAEGAEERLTILEEFYGDSFPIISVSAETGEGLERLPALAFRAFKIIRVFTKAPGKPIDYNDPIVLPVGSTVLDAAYELHKDFAERLKFARIWGEPYFDGQAIGRDEQLYDQNVIEFHAT